MKPTRQVTRRSFMSTVVGGAVAGAAALTIGTEAIAQTGVTNSDPGDPVGNGRTGITNNDPYDPVGRGRVRRVRRGGCATGVTNSDPGDRVGNGRNGLTNSDPSDRAGYGCPR